MIEHIEIRNFQSLEKIDLDLAAFTVIVGQSSSGKSAFVRSLSTLFSNRRGTDFIAHGTSTSTITARMPQGKVSLSRSTTAAKNKYTLVPDGGELESYTKLGGDVPEEVSAFLQVKPKDLVTLAQQFDKPFLLADSPSQAAQTLGALTNVHVIFEAAREANRQRLTCLQTLKTKTSDLTSIESRLEEFEDIEGRQELLQQAESRLNAAQEAQRSLEALNSHIVALRDTKTAIADAQARVDVVVPSVDGIESAHKRLTEFEALVSSARSAGLKARESSDTVEECEALISDLESEYTETLAEMGTCPTCLQAVKG